MRNKKAVLATGLCFAVGLCGASLAACGGDYKQPTSGGGGGTPSYTVGAKSEYYAVGNFTAESLPQTGWDAQICADVTAVPDAVSLRYAATAKQYTLTLNLYEGDEFKVVQVAQQWSFTITGGTLDANRGNDNIYAYGGTGDNDRNFKVKKSGNYTFTFTVDGENKTTAYVRNDDAPILSLALDQDDITIGVDEEHQITPIFVPVDAKEKGTITYESSDEAVATVDATGKVKAIAVGTATVTAKCAGKTATLNVEVIANAVHAETVTLVETKDLHVNEEFTLTPVLAPATGVTDKAKWTSSDTSKVSVDQTGKIKALLPGTSKITVKYGTKTAECEVTVLKDLYLAGASKNPALPDSPDNKKWQAITSYSSINEKILFTLGSDGKYVLDVDLSTNAEFKILTLGAANYPDAGNNAWHGALDSSKLVAANSETGVNLTSFVEAAGGNIKILTYGRYEIVVDPAAENSVSITRTGKAQNLANPIQSVTLSQTIKTLLFDDETQNKYQIAPTFTPFDADEIDSVTYTSSAEAIATVGNTGLVTAVAAGEATITVTCGAKTVTLTIKSMTKEGFVAVTDIALDKTAHTMHVGDEVTLAATVTPENASDRVVAWKSSDTAIATVDANGKVTAIKSGTATITAIAGEKVATCAITVQTDYYLRGALSEYNYNWNPAMTKHSDANTKGIVLTKESETVYKIENVKLNNGNQFKIAIVGAAGDGWGGAYGTKTGNAQVITFDQTTTLHEVEAKDTQSGNIQINTNGVYTITLTIGENGSAMIKVEKTGELPYKIYVNRWGLSQNPPYKLLGTFDEGSLTLTADWVVTEQELNASFGIASKQGENQKDHVGKDKMTVNEAVNKDGETDVTRIDLSGGNAVVKVIGTYNITITITADGKIVSVVFNSFTPAPESPTE